MQPPVPADEDARLTSLHALKVLDSPPEADFDDIVALASEICGAPISLVSLVDTHRQWFKAKIGLDENETDREVAFCAHAIMGRDLMVVPDATADARFADNPFVQRTGGIRFYAGAPLLTSDGSALGTLCVVDHDPHRLTLDQTRALRALARQVSEHLELRRLAVAPRSTEAFELRTVDLAYLLEDKIRDLRPIADARNTVLMLASAGPVAIEADPGWLARALDYVIFNALKLAPPGDRVTLLVKADPTPTLEVSHAGGSITPTWHADLAGRRMADEPLPAAVAAVLRRHEVSVATTSEPLGSPDVCFRLTFPKR
jgi:hypothetical protein